MLNSDELIDPDEHHVTPNEDVLGGKYVPLSRHIEPLAGWEASRQTGREPQHRARPKWLLYAQDNNTKSTFSPPVLQLMVKRRAGGHGTSLKK